MAKTKAQYILGACFFTAAAAILTLVALGTQYWVQGDAEILTSNSNNELSSINYGLFSGVLEQNLGSKTYYKLESKLLYTNRDTFLSATLICVLLQRRACFLKMFVLYFAETQQTKEKPNWNSYTINKM